MKKRLSTILTFICILLANAAANPQNINQDSALTIFTLNDYDLNPADQQYVNSATEAEENDNFLIAYFSPGTKWGNYTKFLNDNGYGYTLNYTGDYLNNLSGGNFQRGTYLNYFYFGFNFDFEKILGLKGSRFFISTIGTSGQSFCDVTGTSQGISNIEAFATWKLYEFWFDQELFDSHLSVKAGLYDLNTEFDTRISSLIFLNPSHGIGPDFSQSGKNGPSIFPTTSLAVRLKYKDESDFFIQSAVFDGVPGDPNNPNGTHLILDKDDGILVSAETGYGVNEDNLAEGMERYVIGAWYYSSRFPSLRPDAGTSLKGNFGIYASAEKFLFSTNTDSSQGFAAFIRIGYAESAVNKFNSYLGTGAVYKGLFTDDDLLGVALAMVQYSHEFKNIYSLELPNINKPEINIEFTYSLQLLKWLNIQPDLQYIINPTYSISNNYSFIGGLRTTLTF